MNEQYTAKYNLQASLSRRLASAVWSTDMSDLLAHQRYWLQSNESLTLKLKKYCHSFRVDLLEEYWSDQIYTHEQEFFDTDNLYRIREVVLLGDEQPWIFARSVMSKEIIEQYPNLLSLDTTPLGEFLIENQLSRGKLEIAIIDHLYARRSLFTTGDNGILVTEVFLPDFEYKE